MTSKGSGVKSVDEWEISMPDEEVCETQDEAENYVAVCLSPSLLLTLSPASVNKFLIFHYRLSRFTSLLHRWEYTACSRLSSKLCGSNGRRTQYVNIISFDFFFPFIYIFVISSLLTALKLTFSPSFQFISTETTIQ